MGKTALFVIAAVSLGLAGCSGSGTNAPVTNSAPPANAPVAGPEQAPPAMPPPGGMTPDPKSTKPLYSASKSITAADVAKLKWLVGDWRGKGGDKPFFNRYKLSGTTLNIESYDDEAMTKKDNASSFVLKDGMFANPEGESDRFAASEITDDKAQFTILTPGKSNAFRMEKADGGNVEAVLEWVGPDGNPNRKTITLEPLKK